MSNVYCQDIYYGKRMLATVSLEGLESCSSDLNTLVSPA